MTSQVTYFTSIDSQYRDDDKYPLETDFGVSFKINDPYATYPNGTFFYPYAQQESQNINVYNPPGLNPGVGIITGSGIPYAKGTPVDSTQVFPRMTIDKNYVDSPIVVKGGKIFQMVETPAIQSLTLATSTLGASGLLTDYTITFCGIIEPDVNTNINFGIIVDDVTFWEYQATGNAYNSSNYSYPFICSITYYKGNGLNKLQPDQLIIMNPVFGVFDYNSTKYVDIQYTDDKKNVFMTFDFTMLDFFLARVNPVTGTSVDFSQYGLVTNLPQLYKKLNVDDPSRNVSKEVSNVIIIGFNADLKNLSEYENFPWGSHQFYTSPNPIDMLPSRNGFNQTRTDKANNIYAAVHVDPFDVNYTIVDIPAPYVPIIGYVGGSPATRNSQPLGHAINLESAGSSYTYRNIIFCSSGPAGSSSNYDTELVFSDVADVVNNPAPSPYTQLVGSGYGTNSAAFFGTGVDGKCLIAYNTFKTSSPTDGLQIAEISGSIGSGIITPKTSALTNSINNYVTAVDAYNTPSNPDFGGLPIVVAVRGNNQISGDHELYVYSYDNSTSTLTQLAYESNATNGEGCCIVKIIQTTVPDSQLFIALGTVKSSALIIYRYNTGGTLIFISETIFPKPLLPLGSTQAQISQVFTYNVEGDYTALGVTFNQKTYLAQYYGPGLVFNFNINIINTPTILQNNSTYNVPFTTIITSDGVKRYNILGSNIYTSVGNVYSANIVATSLLSYQIGNPIDIQNLGSYPENSWYSFLNGYYFGFTRSETNYGANRIYISQSSAYNSIDFYGDNQIVSKHTFIVTRNSGLLLETTPVGSSAFTWMSPIESVIPLLVCPTTYGNLVFYDLSTYPIITSKTQTTSVFSTSSSWVTFDTGYNNGPGGSMYIVGCDGSTTYFTNCLSYDFVTVYNVPGVCSSLYGIFPNSQPNIVNAVNNPNPTIEVYDINDGNLVSSTTVGTAPDVILYCNYIYFVNTTDPNNRDYLAIILYTGGVFQLRFFNLNTLTLLVSPALTLDIPTTYQNISCSNVFNPSTDTIELFIEGKVGSLGRSIILTYHLPGDSSLLSTTTINLDNSRLNQNLQIYGENLSSTNNFLRNQILMSAFVDNAFGGVNYVAVYDTTQADSFVRVAEFPCTTSNPDYAQQTMFTFTSGKTLIFTYVRNGSTSGEDIVITDITNPNLAGQYIDSDNPNQNIFSEAINGKGSANIVSISANGNTNWINNIGDTNIDKGFVEENPFEDPAYFDSQFINVTGLDIDDEQLNLYLSTDWQTKIAVTNPHEYSGAQLVLREDAPELSNSSIIKIATNNGQSIYLTPIQGSNNVYSLDIIKGKDVVIGFNLYGTSTSIYETQYARTSSYFILPSIIQAVIDTDSPNNTAIVSFDSTYSIFQWSNKVETANLSTFTYGSALGYNNNYVYLIGSSNSNQINFYSSGVISQFWKENTFLGANPQLLVPYVFISKYDYNGNYLESDIMDTGSNINYSPSYVHVGSQNIYAVDNISYFEPEILALPRNKDGTLGSIINLNPTFTGTNSLITTNTSISLTTRYKINSNYIDSNGKEYSILTVYNQLNTGSPDNPFLPYSTGTNNLTNKYVYIPVTTSNYTIRSDYYDSTNNTYNIILNQIVPTNIIIRLLPAYVIYPNISPIDTTNKPYYNYFYVANVANGTTYSFGTFAILPMSSNLIIITSTVVDTTLQYYIITNDTVSGNQVILPVKYFTPMSTPVDGLYQINVGNVSSLAQNGWMWLTQFNPNALYTLQFYPASITEIVYYTVRLNNLTIPDRAIRNSTITGGLRYLTNFRYIWMEVYNADDNGNPDPEIVNNTFSNNPNRNAKVIFQIPITYAGGYGNFSFLGSGQSPRLKFNPGFYNIRIRLLDPNNNVIIFENAPSSGNSGDSVFTTEVDKSLMNITVDLELTSILSA